MLHVPSSLFKARLTRKIPDLLEPNILCEESSFMFYFLKVLTCFSYPFDNIMHICRSMLVGIKCHRNELAWKSS